MSISKWAELADEHNFPGDWAPYCCGANSRFLRSLSFPVSRAQLLSSWLQPNSPLLSPFFLLLLYIISTLFSSPLLSLPLPAPCSPVQSCLIAGSNRGASTRGGMGGAGWGKERRKEWDGYSARVGEYSRGKWVRRGGGQRGEGQKKCMGYVLRRSGQARIRLQLNTRGSMKRGKEEGRKERKRRRSDIVV